MNLSERINKALYDGDFYFAKPCKKGTGMRDTILSELVAIEDEKEVTIIHAVESGSRAWGFESPDSDWDVRFIYVERPDRYMSVFKWRDVIERSSEVGTSNGSVELDLAGWDLRKTLGLLYKSNPPLLEHLRSPITYVNLPIMAEIGSLLPYVTNLKSAMYHYLHMAKGNYREYLEGSEVWVKKYLYVLRPCLCMEWISRYNETPPVNIEELLDGLDLPGELRLDINILLGEKRSGKFPPGAGKWGRRIHTIDDYIRTGLSREVGEYEEKWNNERKKREIDRVFRSIVNKLDIKKTCDTCKHLTMHGPVTHGCDHYSGYIHDPKKISCEDWEVEI